MTRDGRVAPDAAVEVLVLCVGARVADLLCDGSTQGNEHEQQQDLLHGPSVVIDPCNDWLKRWLAIQVGAGMAQLLHR